MLEITELQCQVENLQREKAELQSLLDTKAKLVESMETELKIGSEAALQQKSDLEILLDVTAKHSQIVEEELEHQVKEANQINEKRLAQFLEAVPIGVIVINHQGDLCYYNRKAQQIAGKAINISQPPRQFSRQGFASTPLTTESVDFESIDPSSNIIQEIYSQTYVIHTNQPYPLEKQPLVRALQGEYVTVNDIALQREDKQIPLEISATPIYDSPNTISYAIAVFQDISQRLQAEDERIQFIKEREAKNAALRLNSQLQQEIAERQRAESNLQKANQELKRLASLDGLTKVANRRRLDEYLAQEWRILTQEQAPLSFILCDVDYFKHYNDTYGHQVGDDCLKRIAQALRKTVRRSSDLVARYGGEEFAIVLPRTSTDGALRVANAVQEQINKLQITHAHSSVSQYVTLSIGVATLIPNQSTFPDALINLADVALYKSKQQGRNQIS
ncbi:diguanylate cyclase [Candidatus Albibeggiatoa sp. nov. NOAA]|uniref:diguanylate cyclase domain-containing protein n=1 Tax=Candidatus Albibeggiatoa sp. nov. NOAA TaxID=3162724 RepID=UPI0032F0C8A9|nr:diguanylate cyclase [Thiotrichaceae bacterium]